VKFSGHGGAGNLDPLFFRARNDKAEVKRILDENAGRLPSSTSDTIL
jgi:hypothetical protein